VIEDLCLTLKKNSISHRFFAFA